MTRYSVAKNTDAYGSEQVDIPIGDRLNLVYASTVVTKGRGTGITIGTGMNTQIGRIADAISGKQPSDEEEDTRPWHARWKDQIQYMLYVHSNTSSTSFLSDLHAQGV